MPCTAAVVGISWRGMRCVDGSWRAAAASSVEPARPSSAMVSERTRVNRNSYHERRRAGKRLHRRILLNVQGEIVHDERSLQSGILAAGQHQFHGLTLERRKIERLLRITGV